MLRSPCRSAVLFCAVLFFIYYTFIFKYSVHNIQNGSEEFNKLYKERTEGDSKPSIELQNVFALPIVERTDEFALPVLEREDVNVKSSEDRTSRFVLPTNDVTNSPGFDEDRSKEITGVSGKKNAWLPPDVKNNPRRKLKRLISPLKKNKKDEFWPVSLDPSYGDFYNEIDFSRYSTKDSSYLHSVVGEYLSRAERVSKLCFTQNKKQKTNNHLAVNDLVWDTLHSPNLVWCQIAKVASTSWNVNFFNLGKDAHNSSSTENIDEGENIKKMKKKLGTSFDSVTPKKSYLHHSVYKLFPPPPTTKEKNKVFKTALRFLIVRHPFVRLVSAYRGKMLKPNPKPVWFKFDQMQKHIIDNYRSSTSSVAKKYENHPTFEEFVNFVLDQFDYVHRTGDWSYIHCWRPYYKICNVCSLDFQLIMKLETISEDTKFLATLADLKGLKNSTTWIHLNNGTNSDSVAKAYFSELSVDKVQLLYKQYELDFKLFNYDHVDYVRVAEGKRKNKISLK